MIRYLFVISLITILARSACAITPYDPCAIDQFDPFSGIKKNISPLTNVYKNMGNIATTPLPPNILTPMPTLGILPTIDPKNPIITIPPHQSPITGNSNAEKLVALIKSKCHSSSYPPPIVGYISSNTTCYQNIKDDPLVKTNGAYGLLNPNIQYGKLLQCVNFVKSVALMNGAGFDTSYGPAKHYADPVNYPPPKGYTFIPKGQGTVQIGDYPVWNSSPHGHIGVVVSVSGDGNVFDVAEANGAGSGDIAIRPRYLDMPGDNNSNQLKGWLRKL